MFDIVTKNKRLIQIILVLTIIPFAFFGLESYTRSMRGTADVASVGATSITQQEFEEAMRRQQDRLRSALGRGFDAAAFDTPDMRRGLLESLIAQRLVSEAALKGGLTASNESLSELIHSMPAFQRDGKFDEATANAMIRAQGMTAETFAARLRHDVAVGQLTQSINDTAIASHTVAGRLAALENQRREIVEALIPAQQFQAQLKLEDAQLRAYYEAAAAQFRTPERVRAEYVVLSAEELGRDEPVTDAEIRAAYEARASQYAVAEQRRASHILLQPGPDARKKGAEILAEVRKDPARFAELARKYSQDTGSAEKGGDLGFFGRGMLVKPFEEAVFRMKEGEIGGPVESEFGVHVIRLTGIRPGTARPLEDVRKEIADELAKQKGARKFAGAAEGFGNMVYEQSDSLKSAAERFKLRTAATGWISRGGSSDLGLVGHPKVLAALFSQDAIQGKRNTDAIEVAPNVLVAARVIEHQPAAQRKFDEVRAEIETALRRQEAAKLAQKEGASKLEQLATGGDAGLKWTAPRVVTMRDRGKIPPEAQRRIFAADPLKLPAHTGADLREEGYALYRVLRVLPSGARDDQQRAADLANANRLAGAEQFDAWLASLRARAKVEINKANLEKK